MEKALQVVEEDMRKLSQMNQKLFETWKDENADRFSEECIAEMEREWKEYKKRVEPLITEIKKIEKEMTEALNRCNQSVS